MIPACLLGALRGAVVAGSGFATLAIVYARRVQNHARF